MARLLPLALLALPITFVGGVEPRRPPAAEPPPVKLVVVVYFDQFRGDYLGRWGDLFGDRGFRRLTTDGAWFTDCHYPYAVTTTGPGHASGLAGCGGAVHGIINNEWYDRRSGKAVYCAASDRYQFVPPPAPTKPVADAKEDTRTSRGQAARQPRQAAGRNHRRPGEGGRRPGVRAVAEGPLGHLPGRPQAGRGVLAHRPVRHQHLLPRHTAAVGDGLQRRRHGSSSWVGKSLGAKLPGRNVDYAARSRAGRRPRRGHRRHRQAAGRLPSQGKHLPAPVPAGRRQPTTTPSLAYSARPATTCCWRSPRRCVEAEKLGTGDKADLLTVSFSSNDLDRPHLGAGLAGGARCHPAVGRRHGRTARPSWMSKSGPASTPCC